MSVEATTIAGHMLRRIAVQCRPAAAGAMQSQYVDRCPLASTIHSLAATEERCWCRGGGGCN